MLKCISMQNSIMTIPCRSKVMDIYMESLQPPNMMHGKFSSPYCIPVSEQC